MKTILNTSFRAGAIHELPLIIISVLIICLPALAWDFTQEYASIPVSFDSVECQVPWTTGYNYINPTFCDLDGDGDQDMVFGSDWGRISYYRNAGSQSQPEFDYESDQIITLPEVEPQSQRSNAPSFVDIDNDGDFDLIVGSYMQYPTSFGRLFYFENTGSNTTYEFTFIEDFFQGIELQTNSHPVFVDIDNDGDKDLFIGFVLPWTAPAGKLAFYENIGTPEQAIMDSITNNFYGIDLGNECHPSFIDIDADGDYDMFLGDEDGRIHYYRNDGTPEVYEFTFVTDEYAGVDVENIASPTFTDIDGDGDFDLFAGERSWGQDDRRGDINFYENTGTPDSAVFELLTQNFLSVDIGNMAPVSFGDINNDTLLDMFIGDLDGNINYFSNTGTESNPAFTFETETFEGIAANFQSRPTFGDLDRDGDLDMIVGRVSFNTGSLHLYQNDGTPEVPDYTLITSQYLGVEYERPDPELIDIDNDGDLDMFVGHMDNQVIFWENHGSPNNPDFILTSENYLNTPLTNNNQASICFGDIDGDGDYDLLRGRRIEHTIDYYMNTGNASSPEFILEEQNFLGIVSIQTPEPALFDIDTDGDLDLFVGGFCGGVSFWRNNEVSAVDGRRQPAVGKTFSLLPNYPNPFNAATTFSFNLSAAGNVSLKVFDITGREAASLVTGHLSLGQHSVVWDAEGCASGVYLVRLTVDPNVPATESRHHTEARKVVLVK